MVAAKSIGFLFPGQGSQQPGMALDLYQASSAVRQLFQTASEAAGFDLYDLLTNEDSEQLKRTDLSQPAITLANLASVTTLADYGLKPDLCAGFSLGEYAALAVSGVVSTSDCFKLVSARGRAMQVVADQLTDNRNFGHKPLPATSLNQAGMAAIIGLDSAMVEELIEDWRQDGLSDLYAANFNSPLQTVVSGTAAVLEEAEIRFKAAGARRVIRLKVAGPFHSPLVAEAAAIFKPILETCCFTDPLIPLYSSVSGGLVSSGLEAQSLALRQITEAVRWTTVETAIVAAAPQLLLECGPGRVLQGLWTDFNQSLPCRTAGRLKEIEEVIDGIKR